MSRRIAVLGLLAALAVTGGGCVAWFAHVASLRALVERQRTVALALLRAGERDPVTLLRTASLPGLRVHVEDRDDGFVYELAGGDVVRHPPAPPGMPPGAPPPAGPRTGPPPGMPPLDRFVADLARIAPARAESDDLAAVVAPDISELRVWLTALAAIVLALLVAIAASDAAMLARVARMQRMRLEATLEERRAAAAEFQRFLGDAGHELRTPLTIVSGYVDILRRRIGGGSDADLERVLSGMGAETARMRALVEKMLLLARLETPVSVPRLIDAGSVACDVVERMRARFPQRAIELERDGSAAIVIDQDDLYEALHNLIENALKYAPGSPVEVSAGARDGHAEICVRDRGPGIAADERDAIFERFFRGSQRGESEGSGLGLAIVRRVADRWKGRIDLESRPGMTAFTLRFPLAEEEAQ